jgi:hypothetical protein
MLVAQREGRLQLPNDNLDTGSITGGAEYGLEDETYAKLLKETSGKPISNALRQNILAYYADPEKPFATKKKPEAWREVIKELDALKSMPAAGVPAS